MVFGGRFRIRRCNSKASYLPRQSLEKLNNSDPDHGSYKLMLTSNEDLVSSAKPPFDILTHNGKLPSNLPDVLPLGAKLSGAPASPSGGGGGGGSPKHYGSNNNLANSATQQSPAAGYTLYAAQHRYSTPSTMSSYGSSANNNNNNSNNNNNITPVPNYARSQSYDVKPTATSAASPTKFMSQSTIDLKKTSQLLETTLEEPHCESEHGIANKLLSPAQSENNLSSASLKPLSPNSAKRQFHLYDGRASKPSELSERSESGDGRIFRAELVSTTLSTSPSGGVANKPLARKGSLRENIEKITQLQSQLMSAHLSESNLLAGYGLKSQTPGVPKSQTPAEESRKTPQSDIGAESKEQVSNSAGSADAGSSLVCEHAAPTSPTTAPPQTPPSPPSPPLPQPQTCAEQQSPAQSPVVDVGAGALAAAQISQMDTTTDGLKLVQRSELVLRVHASTNEVASQTDDLTDGDMKRLSTAAQHPKDDAQTRITLQPRQPHPIELDCDRMSLELLGLLPSNNKLQDILRPAALKCAADYVKDLYNPNVPLRPAKRDVGTSTLMRMHREASECGVEGHKLSVELQYAEVEVLLTNGIDTESCDQMKQKVDEFIKNLNRKIRILNKEQSTIGEEAAINDELGSALVSKVADKVRPLEATKFRTYIDDIGHITSLLLSLSERLARAENALSTIADNGKEQKSLECKRDRLLEQLDEAKRLKADIDRRGASVACMLERQLCADDFADFDYFINMRVKLIADARNIADKIKCSEEQLSSLSEALIQSDC